MKAGKKAARRLQKRIHHYNLMETDASWRGDCYRKHGAAGFRKPGSMKVY